MIKLDQAQYWLQTIYNVVLKKTANVSYSIKRENSVYIVTTTTLTALLTYMSIVRYHRYKNLDLIRAKYPNPDDILNDSEAAQFVYSIVARKEFPYLSRISLEMAFFKTFTVPTISKILAGTGEFSEENMPRRAEDTDLVMNEVVETYGRIQKQLQHNPNTPKEDIETQYQRSINSIHRLNELHSKYPILNDDYIYTLTLFVFEPINWINRYEWRQLDVREENAFFKVWYDIGKSMNIKGIPETKEELLKFKEEYGAAHIKYHACNWKIGQSTFKLLLTQFPAFLREPLYPIILRVLPSLLESYDTDAFKLSVKESPAITTLVRSIFCMRAYFIRYFLLPRSTFLTRTPFYPNNEGRYVPNFFFYQPRPYLNGYRIEEFGPTKFLPEKEEAKLLNIMSAGQCPMIRKQG